jgi:ACS family hexuronate transporter-like MFS transporter
LTPHLPLDGLRPPFFATTINYIDRQVLGILAPELQGIIGWSEIE